jgi:hypothetical protein
VSGGFVAGKNDSVFIAGAGLWLSDGLPVLCAVRSAAIFRGGWVKKTESIINDNRIILSDKRHTTASVCCRLSAKRCHNDVVLSPRLRGEKWKRNV